MTIHLIKLSVGPEKLSDLTDWQESRLRQGAELMHVTRHMPKRAAEVLDGGSIYWVVKGWLVARQRLLELRPLVRDNGTYCGLVYDKEMVRVLPRQHRPFQGWRYFDPKHAPRDLIKGSEDEALPEDMRRELASIGLI